MRLYYIELNNNNSLVWLYSLKKKKKTHIKKKNMVVTNIHIIWKSFLSYGQLWEWCPHFPNHHHSGDVIPVTSWRMFFAGTFPTDPCRPTCEITSQVRDSAIQNGGFIGVSPSKMDGLTWFNPMMSFWLKKQKRGAGSWYTIYHHFPVVFQG